MQGRFRKGAAVVEFAVVLPLLVLLIFGGIEGASAIQLRSALQNACRESARHSITPQATLESCQEIANQSLVASRVRSSQVSVYPDPAQAQSGTLLSTTVTAGFGENSWTSGFFFLQSANISATLVVRKE